ncbi:D-alanyl-D-alanine carboxypeptidase (penicillin-binding protein 5/6) [Nocardia transvalensis]|uniref:D-alanyl-D-alanine carboxypeptidase (Penicillin-binding protein 5/6) n=1 Tax=Nocardia transvalensis TaxID=37333 RepID=A0A7W9PAY8_9NOCA|nr:serine hydrolase [Nocardia transvalensis]MBB5912772.1 D-alanyl-D-alanine carboxypeptidase (penicillin-binding protein 5/6) [Nocardia transvalensis]
MRTFARVLQAVVAGVLIVVSGQAAVAAPTTVASHSQLPVPAPEPEGVQAVGAALADGNTGAVRWSREMNTQAPIGSIAKVMTALVVLNEGGLDRPITVPDGIIAYDNRFGASTADLVPGEVLTARQLLYAMLLPSGCDAAYALAEAYGPGQEGFIAKMNDTARQLGLGNTHFTDPSGLPYPDGYATYSTPADLVTLGLRAMIQPEFRDIVKLQTYHVPAAAGNRDHVWETTNLLVQNYRGAIGIKTGSTDAAGTCLLFEAVRAGQPLIGVVLHSSPDDEDTAAEDAERMLDWGYGPILGALPIS